MAVEASSRLNDNLGSVRERISAACQRVGRNPNEVTLVAVTKYAELSWLEELLALGVKNFGESRPQQLVQRAHELPQNIAWHMIGHLQRNKADAVLAAAKLIHSVDSVRLFDHLAKLCQPRTPAKILLEVNVSGEASKDGLSEADLHAAWPRLAVCESIQICGLMTMAPLDKDLEAARPVFRQLRELRDALRSQTDGRHPLHELSMGMSGDFEIGVEEGATIVRIGSSLFEGLASPSKLSP